MKKTKDKNPVPFCLPGSVKEQEERMIREVDSSLKDEERVFVRHYLRLAAMILCKEPAVIHPADQEYKQQRLEGRKAA